MAVVGDIFDVDAAVQNLREIREESMFGPSTESIVAEAKRRDVDGVICGHIHHAASIQFDGVHYVNTGDWVESCTAIGENKDGTFELIRWLDVVDARERETQAQLNKELQVA